MKALIITIVIVLTLIVVGPHIIKVKAQIENRNTEIQKLVDEIDR